MNHVVIIRIGNVLLNFLREHTVWEPGIPENYAKQRSPQRPHIVLAMNFDQTSDIGQTILIVDAGVDRVRTLVLRNARRAKRRCSKDRDDASQNAAMYRRNEHRNPFGVLPALHAAKRPRNHRFRGRKPALFPKSSHPARIRQIACFAGNTA